MVSTRKQLSTRTGIAIVVVFLVAVAAVSVWLLLRPGGVDGTRTATTSDESATAPEGVESDDGAAPKVPSKTARPIDEEPAQAPAGGRFVGRAVDADSGKVVRGATAAASPKGATPEGPAPKGPAGRAKHRSREGKAPGHFEIRGVPAGAYGLKVRAPSYLPATVANVELRKGAVRNVGDVSLVRGAYVKGAVVDAEAGTPIPRAVVRGLGADGAKGPTPRAATDDRGQFTLGPFTGGAMPLRISRLGYEVLQLPEVQLPKGGVATLGSLRLHVREDEVPEGIGPAGPGLALRHEPGRVTVRQVVPGSPADKATITAGLVVVSIEGYPAEDLSPEEAANLLHGSNGSVLSLDLSSPGSSSSVNYRIIRQ